MNVTAFLVLRARETNVFAISVNVAAGQQVQFKLVYEELLQRVRGVYKHYINVQADKVHTRQNDSASRLLYVMHFYSYK